MVTAATATKINIGWLLAGLGVFFFLWFVASLRETVRKATVDSVGDGMLGFFVTIGGTAYGAVTLMVLGEAAGVRTMSDDTFQHRGLSWGHPRERATAPTSPTQLGLRRSRR